MRKFGLIGHPIAHSLSPHLFKAAYDGKFRYDLIEGESFPQCTLSSTPWGGKVINFIPGHKEECVTHPVLSQNINVLMRYLLA
jgi:hypothetical protein